MDKLDTIISEINIDKEILQALPKNNQKNIALYQEKVNELCSKYEKYEEELFDEINKRFNEVNNLKEKKDIENVKTQIENIEKQLYLLNDTKTSYEKMELDKKIESLSYYYKKNLEEVNESILFIIRKFNEVGINIDKKDFCYSNFVNEYMEVFFEEAKKGTVNSQKVKDKFEEIYWKCSEIITHIELNIRYLYMNNEKEIDKYYEKKEIELLKNKTAQDIFNEYYQLKREAIENEEKDKNIIINKLLNGKINAKDYSGTNIKADYIKIVSNKQVDNITEKELDDIYENVLKLGNSIYEYRNYLKFLYIINDIKKIYEEKDKYKNECVKIKKDILKKQQLILKLNNKIQGNEKKGTEKFVAQQNALILETKALYKNFDECKIHSKMIEALNENSSVLEMLDCASCFYKYLYKSNLDNFKNITEEEIQNNISKLQEFVRWPYFTILNNIKMSENKDVLLTVKDRYKLLNINIEKEDFEEDNMNNLEKIIEHIKTARNITKNRINLEELSYICEMKKVLNK